MASATLLQSPCGLAIVNVQLLGAARPIANCDLATFSFQVPTHASVDCARATETNIDIAKMINAPMGTLLLHIVTSSTAVGCPCWFAPRCLGPSGSIRPDKSYTSAVGVEKLFWSRG